MKNERIHSLALVAVLIAAGCGGVPEGEDASSLGDGEYDLLESGVEESSCGLAGDWYAAEETVQVSVGTDEVTFEFEQNLGELTYEIDGTSLLDDENSQEGAVDFGDSATASDFGLSQTYDCVLAAKYTYSGRILGRNEVEFTDSFEYERQSGSQCADVESALGFGDLPCRDEVRGVYRGEGDDLPLPPTL